MISVNSKIGKQQTSQMTAKIKKLPYPCSYCDNSYATPAGLTGHKKVHRDEPGYTTKASNEEQRAAAIVSQAVEAIQRNPSFSAQRAAEQTCTASITYACEICGDAFPSKRARGGHMNAHRGHASGAAKSSSSAAPATVSLHFCPNCGVDLSAIESAMIASMC